MTPRAGFRSAQYSAEQDPRKFRAGMLSLDFEEGSGLGLDHVVSGFGVVLVPRGSTVFTCIGALATPCRTGPSLESIYRVSLTADLCEG